MTELRKRMIECLQLRGLSARTQESYVRAVRQLAEHYHKSPDLITEEELRQYFLYLKNVKHYSRSTATIAICGIKFFFERTLEKDWTTFNLVRLAPEKKLPVILSLAEVRQILNHIRLPRYKVCLTTIGIVRLIVQRGDQTLGAAYCTDAHRLSLSSSSLPSEIISHCVWLYFRFALSFRDVEEMLAMRGVALTYETVREWCLKFGQTYANDLRRRSSRPGDQWHLDEVFLKINGRIHYLWRAVDQDGEVLDILFQSKRDKKAAKKFFRKLLKGLRYVPRVIITDKLKSYSAARTEVMPSVEHCQDKGQNNRAENSHQPTKLRERVMRRFKSVGHAQRFLSALGIITSHFRVGRHLLRASSYRTVMKSRFAAWKEAICLDAIVK